jgi:hypothetical protein
LEIKNIAEQILMWFGNYGVQPFNPLSGA